MEELTTEQKAQRYDEALIWMQDLYPTMEGAMKEDAEHYFPELCESKDEKIRKELLEQIAYIIPNDDEVDNEGNTLPTYQKRIDKYRTWLEEQDEPNPYSGVFFKYNDHTWGMCARNNGVDILLDKQLFKHLEKQNSQNHANSTKTCNIEPKFHEGEWVILTAGELSTTLQIVKVDTYKRLYWFNDNSYLPIVDEECLHHWTIQDAKDGDVLVDGNLPFIFKKIDTNKHIYAYCGISVDDGFKIESDGESGEWTWMQDIKPATKEQRDVLFAKMREAGYEWDADRKELKKIEQSKLTAFEEAVKDMMDDYRDAIDDNKATTEEVKERAAYMLSLIPQKPAEWSEDDEGICRAIINDIANDKSMCTFDISKGICDKKINWLKSLKERVACEANCTTTKHWKPSEEQMEALDDFIYAKYPNIEKHGAVVKSLYQDLKKLSGK